MRPVRTSMLVLSSLVWTGCAGQLWVTKLLGTSTAGNLYATYFPVEDPSNNKTETWEPVRKQIDDGTLSGGRLAPAALDLRRMGEERKPLLVDPRGSYKQPTYFALAIRQLGDAAIAVSERVGNDLLAKDELSAEDIAVLADLQTTLDILVGFPLDEAVPDDKAASFRERQQTYKTAWTARLTNLERQVALVEAAEAAGQHSFALQAWSLLLPLDDAGQAKRTAALARLAPLVAEAARTRLAWSVTKASAANAAAARGAAEKSFGTSHPLMDFGDDGAIVTVTVEVGPAKIARTDSMVKLSWEHQVGTRVVENEVYTHAQHQLEDARKEYASYAKRYASMKCNGSGSLGVKAPAGKCAAAEYGYMERHKERIADAEHDLRTNKPTRTVPVMATHPYQAREDVVVVEQAVTFALRYADGRPAGTWTTKAVTRRTAIQHPANASVGLPAKSDRLPSDAELQPAVDATLANTLSEGLGEVQRREAVSLDARLAAAKTPAERAELQVRRYVVGGMDGGAPSDATRAALGKPLRKDDDLRALVAKAAGGRPERPAPR